MSFLIFLKSKLGKLVAGVAGFLAVLLGAYFKGRGDQKDKAKAKVVKKTLKVVDDVRKVEDDIREREPDANRDRLRKFARDPE